MKKILVIEDDQTLQVTLQDRLENEGYAVTVEENGVDGEKEALTNSHDLVILDVMLPDRDGFQICRNLRERGKTLPILMLTARTTTIDTVMGLKLGADDYMRKPFEFQELLARIEALLRRGEKTRYREGPDRISFGNFTVDTEKQQLLKNGSPLTLNLLEYRLLEYLVLNPDRTISRNEILDEVWGYGSESSTRTVDVHIAWLREKLSEKNRHRHLLTERGRGYRFVLTL